MNLGTSRASDIDNDAVQLSNEQEHPPVTTIRSLSLLPSLRASETVAGPGSALHELLAIVRRRKWVILAAMTTIMVGALWLITSLTPRYSAAAEVLIEPRAGTPLDLQSIVAGLSGDIETLQSQVEIMKSRRLAGSVVSKLALWNHHEFAGENGGGWLTFVPFLGSGAGSAQDPVEESDRRRRTVTSFLHALDVSAAGRSRVIEVAFESEDRVLAALAANTVAELYIVDHLESRFEQIREATKWLNERVGQLREQVAGSEQAIEEYRAQVGLIEGRSDRGVLQEQIAEITTEIAQARSALAEAEARVALVEQARDTQAGVGAVPDIIASPAVQQLNEKAQDLRQRLAQSRAEYGQRHPVMINLQAEVENVENQMRLEIERIVGSIRNEATLARSRIAALNKTMRDLDADALRVHDAEVQLSTLRSEAEADRLMFETFLARFNSAENNDFVQPNARIISPAEVPERPSFPNRSLMALAALAMSIAMTAVLVLVIELLQRGFRSADELEKSLGVPGLGLVPEVRSVPGFRRNLEDLVLDNPFCHHAEALRRLYTTLLLNDEDTSKTSIVFTSAMPGEGKTTLVVALGRVIASQGKRVVVVDCDFRRPRLHEALGADSSVEGLMQLLVGDVKMSEILVEDGRSGLYYITAGADLAAPMNLLESQKFREILDTLKSRFDIVLIDAPPVLAVSDGLILGARADRTVVVAKWQSTTREAVATTVKQIVDTGGAVAGVVLTKVNIGKNAGYRYGDSMLYTKAFSKYYTR